MFNKLEFENNIREHLNTMYPEMVLTPGSIFDDRGSIVITGRLNSRDFTIIWSWSDLIVIVESENGRFEDNEQEYWGMSNDYVEGILIEWIDLVVDCHVLNDFTSEERDIKERENLSL